jgi:hypothetical protein
MTTITTAPVISHKRSRQPIVATYRCDVTKSETTSRYEKAPPKLTGNVVLPLNAGWCSWIYRYSPGFGRLAPLPGGLKAGYKSTPPSVEQPPVGNGTRSSLRSFGIRSPPVSLTVPTFGSRVRHAMAFHSTLPGPLVPYLTGASFPPPRTESNRGSQSACERLPRSRVPCRLAVAAGAYPSPRI